MSRDGSVDLEWADGQYRFRLGLGELRELQEKTGCGPEFLHARLQARNWMVDDARETIRLGLIGGGLDPAAALTLVKRYVDERPASITHKAIVSAILLSALTAAPDGEKPGKPRAARAKKTPTRSPTAGSPLPPSTEPALS